VAILKRQRGFWIGVVGLVGFFLLGGKGPQIAQMKADLRGLEKNKNNLRHLF